MNIVYDNSTGEVLAENIPDYKLGITFKELVKAGHKYGDLRVHTPTAVDALSEWRR